MISVLFLILMIVFETLVLYLNIKWLQEADKKILQFLYALVVILWSHLLCNDVVKLINMIGGV